MGCAIRLFSASTLSLPAARIAGRHQPISVIGARTIGDHVAHKPTRRVDRGSGFVEHFQPSGFHVFGGGKAREVSSSKAVFLSMANSGEDEGVHLALTPTLLGLPPLEERQMEAISQELQLQLLMCRVRNLDEVREFSPSKLSSVFVGSEVACNLGASVLGDAAIAELIAPLLRRLEQDKIALRGCHVQSAMIEVMWTPSHADRELGQRALALTWRNLGILRARDRVETEELRLPSPSRWAWHDLAVLAR